jgi:hypothetical protein
MDIASGKETLLYQYDGNVNIAAVNDAGTKFVLSRDSDQKSLDNDLYMVDVRSKKETHLTPHKDASEFGDVNFLADSLLLTSNDGREFQALVQMRKKNASGDDWSEANRETTVVDGRTWDIGGLALTNNASMVAYTVNIDPEKASSADLRFPKTKQSLRTRSPHRLTIRTFGFMTSQRES